MDATKHRFLTPRGVLPDERIAGRTRVEPGHERRKSRMRESRARHERYLADELEPRSSRRLVDHRDEVFRVEVHVAFGRRGSSVPHDPRDVRQGDPVLDRGRRRGVPSRIGHDVLGESSRSTCSTNREGETIRFDRVLPSEDVIACPRCSTITPATQGPANESVQGNRPLPHSVPACFLAFELIEHDHPFDQVDVAPSESTNLPRACDRSTHDQERPSVPPWELDQEANEFRSSEDAIALPTGRELELAKGVAGDEAFVRGPP